MFKDRTALAYLALVLIISGVIYLLSPILAPFLVAAFLAYLGDPIVDRLETKGMSRTVGVCVVFFLMTLGGFLVLLVLTPVLEAQVRLLINGIPSALAQLDGKIIPRVEALSGMDIPALDTASIALAAQQHWDQLGGILGVAAQWLGNYSQVVFALIASATIVPVVAFYLLRDWDILIEKIHALIPRKFAPKVLQLSAEADAVLAEFFRGQLLLMLSQAVFFSVALSIMGLKLAVLIGLLAGAVSFVPYLGLLIGVAAALIAALMQFQELTPLIYVVIIFGVGQMLEGLVLQPLLIGDRIGMHPVAVIFAVMAGGQLFGFVGVLIALPSAAVIIVLLRHMHEFYVNSELYTPSSTAGNQAHSNELD